jgi:DnaJ family protein C protein 28
MAQQDDLPRDLDWAATVAERKIQEAVEEGLFENLPGRGKPLDLRANPFEPPGAGVVNRILKHNKVLPAWVTIEQEIEAERALALAALARWEAAEPGLTDDERYPTLRSMARESYATHMQRTNDLILKYNISSPFALRAPVPFMMKRRLREFDERYGTGEGAAAPPALETPRK